MNAKHPPGLYIVATPIGNLSDITDRAKQVLEAADLVLVEDTRVTGKLLNHLSLKKKMQPYHDHNGDAVRPGILARLSGEVIALVSDAGTPLISDPGYKLVRDARAGGHLVTTIPGACAAISALTLAGLPTDRFLFLGFLPAKAKAKAEMIAEYGAVRATLVLYESGPRLGATLDALTAGLGDREAAVTREITKAFEECATGTLSTLAGRYRDTPPKGEIVIVVGPPDDAPSASAGDDDVRVKLADALTRLPVAKAASEVAKETGADRKTLYALALELRKGA